jgi:hypothetical protein
MVNLAIPPQKERDLEKQIEREYEESLAVNFSLITSDAITKSYRTLSGDNLSTNYLQVGKNWVLGVRSPKDFT